MTVNSVSSRDGRVLEIEQGPFPVAPPARSPWAVQSLEFRIDGLPVSRDAALAFIEQVRVTGTWLPGKAGDGCRPQRIAALLSRLEASLETLSKLLGAQSGQLDELKQQVRQLKQQFRDQAAG
jgi:hypothetical protein